MSLHPPDRVEALSVRDSIHRITTNRVTRSDWFVGLCGGLLAGVVALSVAVMAILQSLPPSGK